MGSGSTFAGGVRQNEGDCCRNHHHHCCIVVVPFLNFMIPFLLAMDSQQGTASWPTNVEDYTSELSLLSYAIKSCFTNACNINVCHQFHNLWSLGCYA